MKHLLARAALAAGSLALTGSLTAAAIPAAAADSITFEAYASYADGDIVTAGPVGDVTTSDTSTLHNASIPAVLTTGLAFTSASATSAFARVRNATATITWGLPVAPVPQLPSSAEHSVTVTASHVEAWCRETPDLASQSTISGVLYVDGHLVTHLPQHPAPDTVIPVMVDEGGTPVQEGTLTLAASDPALLPGGLAGFVLTIDTGIMTTQTVVVSAVSCAPPR